MSTNITYFEVAGLFGGHTVRLEFRENKLVLVGENGSGKSTVLAALFYFLTRRWSDLADIPARGFSIGLDGSEVSLSADNLQTELRSRRKRGRFDRSRALDYVAESMGIKVARQLIRELREVPVPGPADPALRSSLVSLADEYGLPFRVVSDLWEEQSDAPKREISPVAKCSKLIDDSLSDSVMFLPTYRRIEKELPEIIGASKVEAVARNRRHRTQNGDYYELVEFGMGDVLSSFENAMSILDSDFRSSLNALTGLYLSDVINRKYENLDLNHLGEETTISAIRSTLKRVPEVTLPHLDRQKLEGLLQRLQAGDDLQTEDRILAHFLNRLSKIHGEQDERERSVRALVKVCNKYLTKKSTRQTKGVVTRLGLGTRRPTRRSDVPETRQRAQRPRPRSADATTGTGRARWFCAAHL